MKVRILGARGSIPSPLTPKGVEERFRKLLEKFSQSDQSPDEFCKHLTRPSFGGYGGNTISVEVSTAKQSIIIDGGSGLRNLGLEMLAGPCGKGKGEVHIFLTHFHWDHLIGLPFFVPLFIPGNQIHVYAVQPILEEVFQTLFKKPYFPVPLEALGSDIHYHQLKKRKPFAINDITLTPYKLDHPDPCWGFRIEADDKTYSHCVDTECTRVSRSKLGRDLPLYQDVDLMVFDSQYTLSEIIDKIDWGHSAAPIGLDIAIRENIKKVIFVHHDPAAPDEKIGQAYRDTATYFEDQIRNLKTQGLDLPETEWCFGYEGMIIEL